MCYRLVVIPTTMKLCMRAMPTITISIHELQICKQQQIASGTKSCKSILMLITLVLAFLQIKIGTLVHHITLMTKRRLQVCKQQQTASGNKLVNLHYCL